MGSISYQTNNVEIKNRSVCSLTICCLKEVFVYVFVTTVEILKLRKLNNMIWKKFSSLFTIALLTLCPLFSWAGTEKVIVDGMKVEYETTPLGIDVKKPRFSWQLKILGHEQGIIQKFFRLQVSDDDGHIVWNSGKCKSSISLNIPYQGSTLQPATHYNWKVDVWTGHKKQSTGSSWFETGLMSKDSLYAAWDGAQWIGGDDQSRALYAPYLNVFKLNFTVQLDFKSHSQRAGFIYGANEERMTDLNKNLFHIRKGYNENYYEIELDISGLSKNRKAQLCVYRVGYSPKDVVDRPIQSFDIPDHLMNQTNRYAPHVVSFSSANGTTIISFDGEEIGKGFYNPMGSGGDVISFPSLCDIGYQMQPGQKATFSRIEVHNFRSPSNILAAFNDETFVDGGEGGKIMTFSPSRNSMALLRSKFTTSGTDIVRARLYVSARGIYDMYVNGQLVSKDYFNPGLTQYNKTQLYQTFDVTSLLQSGTNVMGAQLGEGWWSGGISYTPENWNMFGDRQSLLAKLVITYRDGHQQIVVTKPSLWKYSVEGPLVYGSFFQGEVYDAEREQNVLGWSTANFDDKFWKPCKEIGLKGNVAMDGIQADYSQMKLFSCYGQSVAAVDTITAVSVDEVRPHLYIYDFGQNAAGVPLVHFSGLRPGTKVMFRFAEVKYPDLSAYAANVGMIMLENIRSARSEDVYIARGGEEVFSPRFTSHGYRFMEVSGLDEALPLGNVKMVTLSSIRQLTAGYETSNIKVNRLWQNVTWSARSNFLSIPTDCPQRNERMGWCGDISVFSRTATYLGQVPGFLKGFLHSMRDVQGSDGRFPDVAPVGGGFGGLLWGSAGITVPWESFQQFADTTLLAEHYPAMKRYISYILHHDIDPKTNIIVQDRQGSDLGDWLSMEYEKNDKSLLWECYFIYDLERVADIAAILGNTEDSNYYSELADKRKAFFNETYLQPGSLKTICSDFYPDRKGSLVDIQTSYVLPLAFHVLPPVKESQMVKNLAETVIRENKTDGGQTCAPYSLMTGFIGTAWINPVLSMNGRSDLAYRLLQQTSFPSWLYSVDQGATTIWERVNSYTRTDGFGGNNSMNSFNHYSFGAVGSWMVNYSLGIQRDDKNPGFHHFLLQPEIDQTGQMTFAKGYYDSMYGRIESSWQIGEGKMRYEFTVPANTSATLFLPAPSVRVVKEDGRFLSRSSRGIEIGETKNDIIKMELVSGHYVFEVMNAHR